MDGLQSRQRIEGAAGELSESLAASVLNKSAPLDRLPDELLCQIISYIPDMSPETSKFQSLAAFSRTSRRIHRIVMERLYACLDNTSCKLYPFLRTVMANKNAAKYVRSVTLKLSFGKTAHATRVSAEDRTAIEGGFRRLGLADWQAWTTEVNDRGVSLASLFAATLMFLPGLESLTIGNTDWVYLAPRWLDVIAMATNRSRQGNMHLFTHLRSVQILSIKIELQRLVPLFRLPSLKTLRLRRLMEWVLPSPSQPRVFDMPGDFKWPSDIKSPSITELFLEDCMLDTGILTLMTDSCQALETFRYRHRHKEVYKRQGLTDGWYEYGHWCFSDGHWYFTNFPRLHASDLTGGQKTIRLRYPEISDAMSRHSDSLVEIEFLVDGDVEGVIGNGWLHSELHGVWDWQDVPNLKTLRISVSVLLGQSRTLDSLPRSLTHLTLVVHCKKDVQRACEALQNLVPHCHARLPLLKAIMIEQQPPMYSKLDIRDWAWLERKYADLGIQWEPSTSSPEPEENSEPEEVS